MTLTRPVATGAYGGYIPPTILENVVFFNKIQVIVSRKALEKAPLYPHTFSKVSVRAHITPNGILVEMKVLMGTESWKHYQHFQYAKRINALKTLWLSWLCTLHIYFIYWVKFLEPIVLKMIHKKYLISFLNHLSQKLCMRTWKYRQKHEISWLVIPFW